MKFFRTLTLTLLLTQTMPSLYAQKGNAYTIKEHSMQAGKIGFFGGLFVAMTSATIYSTIVALDSLWAIRHRQNPNTGRNVLEKEVPIIASGGALATFAAICTACLAVLFAKKTRHVATGHKTSEHLPHTEQVAH